ncbi:MAG: response regulator [Patescibacteria group bacterium]|nr:response regulator [Patescibacteria group bacterium]
MKKILFIEDEAVLQKTFGDTVKEEGYKMISALDGAIGLELAQKEKPDLILLDLVLPKINGFEVLKKLKENPRTKKISVIVLTNLETTKDINRVIELGATSYLVKANYSLKEIIKKIKEILGDK